MHTSRTSWARLLPKRLDPDYYAPQHLRDEEAIEAVGAITLGSTGKLFVGPFGSELPTRVFVDEGVPLFRVGNVGAMEVDSNNLAQIPVELHRRLSASEVVPGDVLIVKASVGEKVCVLPDSMERANITQHIIGLHPNGSVDERFIAAAIFSSYGRRQVRRRALGAIIQYLGLLEARTVLLPSIHKHAQAYIGDKVRQAEKLRAWARRLVAEAKDHLSKVHSRDGNGWRGSWRRKSTELSEDRLDSWFYAPVPMKLTEDLRSAGANPIGKQVRPVHKNTFDPTKAINYFEIGNLDIATGCAWPSVVEADNIPSRAQRSVRAWDVLVSTVRPERKNIGLVDPDASGQLVASSGFAVLRAEAPEVAAFVCWYLRSDSGTDQLLRWKTGAAYPAIDDDAVVQVLTPEYENSEITRHGKRWMRIPQLLRTSKALVAAAQSIVEALIERKVTETELVAAHKDPVADRALLERLSADGLDVEDADPLFPDLDKLEELLNEAQQGNDE